MINLISREEVFFKSALVDHYISEGQNQDYPDLAYYIDDLSAQPGDYYDHLEPFHNNKEVLDDFSILGYPEKNKLDYITHRSKALIHFFELMDIKRLYLLEKLKCDWVKFPFSHHEKREALKGIVNQATYNEAFELDIDDLSIILPWFHSSGRYNTSIIEIFSANSEINLATYLCDDANFHTSFFSKDRKKIASAVSAAGLIMGGLEICEM